MSEGQWRVFFLLLASFGIQFFFNPLTKSIAYNVFTGGNPFGAISDKNTPLDQQLTAPAVGLILYAVGFVIFLGLADVIPTITTWIAVLILTLVVLHHANDIAAIITLGDQGLGQLRGGK